MRLSQHYQPVTLDKVVGQPAIVRRLKRLVAVHFPYVNNRPYRPYRHFLVLISIVASGEAALLNLGWRRSHFL
jgi:hypothetical protein